MVQTADPPCRNKHEFKARTMVLYCLACTAQGDSLAQTANAQSSHFGTVYKKKVQSLIVQQTAPIVFCFILYPSMNILQFYSKVYYLRMSPRAFHCCPCTALENAVTIIMGWKCGKQQVHMHPQMLMQK